jgi:hypothetical protein
MKEERFSVEAWKKAELIKMQPKVESVGTPPKTRTIPKVSEAQKMEILKQLQEVNDAAKKAFGRPLREILKK